jgi:hypothetical protein
MANETDGKHGEAVRDLRDAAGLARANAVDADLNAEAFSAADHWRHVADLYRQRATALDAAADTLERAEVVAGLLREARGVVKAAAALGDRGARPLLARIDAALEPAKG